MGMALRLARKPGPTTASAIADRRETVAWLCQVIDYVDHQRESVMVFPRPFLDAENANIAAHISLGDDRSTLILAGS